MKKSISKTERKNESWCPYCEDELATSQLPYCQPCKVEVFNCTNCGTQVPRSKKVCPKCGSAMKPVEKP
jgi:hypothetical protein